jgi:DNA modification methylase
MLVIRKRKPMMNYQMFNGSCNEVLTWIPGRAMIFADPPDNIGLGYENYEDRMPDSDYVEQLGQWLRLFCAKADTVWFSFNSRWLLDLAPYALALRDEGWEFLDAVQTFSFYQHNKNDLGNAHRPLWRFRKSDAGLYPDQARIPSWRQQFGDQRAASGGKVPGDAFDFTRLPERTRRYWHTRAIQCGDWVVDSLIPDTHFDFTRVVGNSKQRRSWHPTQLNEGLVRRCVLLSTKPGDTVIDPFGGTGTTLRVCKDLGDRHCQLIEIDPEYCRQIQEEHDLIPYTDGFGRPCFINSEED